jgi:hypothetical protein
MDARMQSKAVRQAVLELVGSGHTAAEIRALLAGHAEEADLRYAESLVKVRDEMQRPLGAAA